MKVFFFYISTFAFFLTFSIIFRIFLKDNPHQLIINRIFLITEFAFLSCYYSNFLILKHKKIIFTIFTISFFLYSLYDFVVSTPGEFNFSLLVTECLFFLMVIVYYFYEKIKFNITSPVFDSPDFWISVAFLIYFSGNFFLFLFSETMFKNPDFKIQYTAIYGTVTIIKNILLCAALFFNSKIVDQNDKANKTIDIDLGTFNPLSQHTNL